MRPPDRRPRSRLRRLLASRRRRASLLLAFGYVTAALGIALGLAGDAGGPTDRLTAVAIGLLFASFLALFQASRTLLATGREE